MINVKTGGKDVFDAKTFIAVNDVGTSITIGQGGEALKFELEFISDESIKEQPVDFTPIDTQSAKVSFKNWNNSLGTTFIEPVEVGTFLNRKLYLLFNIRKIGANTNLREVHVTALLGEGV